MEEGLSKKGRCVVIGRKFLYGELDGKEILKGRGRGAVRGNREKKFIGRGCL